MAFRSVAAAACAGAALAGSGCQTGGPAEPDGAAPGASPATIVFEVRDGETDAPLSGARVIVAGAARTADASGRVGFESVGPGATVDVEQPGYLTRQTAYHNEGALFVTALWPLTRGTTAEYVRDLVYRDTLDGSDVALRRITASAACVIRGPGFPGDPDAAAALDRALAEVGALAEGRVSFEICTEPIRPVDFTLEILPDEDVFDGSLSTAHVHLRTQGDAIIGGLIHFRSDAAARRPEVLAHELGHGFGFRHTSEAGDVMSGLEVASRPASFSDRERLVGHMMLRREPGNRFPDEDRSAPATAARREELVACGP